MQISKVLNNNKLQSTDCESNHDMTSDSNSRKNKKEDLSELEKEVKFQNFLEPEKEFLFQYKKKKRNLCNFKTENYLNEDFNFAQKLKSNFYYFNSKVESERENASINQNQHIIENKTSITAINFINKEIYSNCKNYESQINIDETKSFEISGEENKNQKKSEFNEEEIEKEKKADLNKMNYVMKVIDDWIEYSSKRLTPEIVLKKNKKKKHPKTLLKNDDSFLIELIEKSLKLDRIPREEVERLNDFEKKILFLFIQKKFNTEEVKFESENVVIPQIKKSKRNEEILKFSLKGFFKKRCMKSKSDINNQKNFFKLKKILCIKIFEEISNSLNLSLQEFLALSFVDEKKLMIRGNKRILLYNQSSIFKNYIGDYLKNDLIKDYVKKRKEKIHTIVTNIYIKFLQDGKPDESKIEEFFLKNPKLKLPWSDCELETAQSYCLKNFT
jgi:hypothetical protein